MIEMMKGGTGKYPTTSTAEGQVIVGEEIPEEQRIYRLVIGTTGII
jgi:hypothetical protein